MPETKDRKRAPGAGRKPKPLPEHKIRLQVLVRPDLAAWLERTAGTGHGAVSRYVESLINRAEIESRIL